ncbi:hypothetical protein [Colwellia sp. BRX8-9]|uniref:hypothetical protein n=1 Tax=Colwellia sp. BRX8-9 TaxID=2759831 RepID=UPI0015F3DBF9|nr:hypothetical protein [Colwellia sp. BRX8-9]MBA6349862.1 hypothetical protein [Colwellia sp. BRX8-9]
MTVFTNDEASLNHLLDLFDINPEEKNIGLFIRNLNTLLPYLKKIDFKREFFTHQCEQQLSKRSLNVWGPLKHVLKVATGNHLFDLLVHINDNNMTDEVCSLSALFVYSQLNKLLLTGHTASPLVKTNRGRLRIFIQKVSKGGISIIQTIDANKSTVNAETLLADVIANDSIEEHRKTAILLNNIHQAVLGNNEFAVMNKTKNEENKSKSTHKHCKKKGKNKKRRTCAIDDVSNILNISKTVYTQKPALDAESTIVHEVFETTETTLVDKEVAKQFTQTKSAVENNYIQDHARVLKDKEARKFYNELLLQFNNVESVEQKKAVLGMLFVLLLGVDDTWLSDIILVCDIKSGNLKSGSIIVSTKGYIQFEQIELPNAYSPIKKDLPYLQSDNRQILILPLPISLIPLLIEVKSLMSSSNFTVDESVYAKEFNQMRTKLNRRFTNDKLREFTFNLYYRESDEDEVYATLLKPSSPYLIPASCYYASVNLNLTEEIHVSAFTRVFGECTKKINTNNTVFLGSKLCINKEKINEWLPELKCTVKWSIKGNRTIDELIVAHNNYVLYVTTVLLITTCHRPVNDVFDNRNHIFIDDGFALIGDKASGNNHDLRLVTLCRTAKLQIKYYLTHLKNISNRISVFDLETAGKLKALIEPSQQQSLPFLLLLERDRKGRLKIKGVNKSSIDGFWSEMKLPTNFYRHMMCSALKENGVKRELINFFMGHFLMGQNALSPSSPIKPQALIGKLSTEIEKIVESLNLQAIKGISDGNIQYDIPLVFPEKSLFGIDKRLEIRVSNVRDANEFVSAYLKDKLPQFFTETKESLTESTLDEIRDSLMLENKSKKRNKILIIHALNKAIKKRARLANRKPERLYYVTTGFEKSALTDDFAIKAQQYIVFKNIISREVIDKVAHPEINQKKCVYKLILVYLHCLSQNLPYPLSITDFYHLIKQEKTSINNALSFEYSYKEYGFIRFFPDSLSLLLIRKLKTQLSNVAPYKNTIDTALSKIMKGLHKKNRLIPKSFTQLQKVVKSGWIFKESPAFHAYRELKVFHALQPEIRHVEFKNWRINNE